MQAYLSRTLAAGEGTSLTQATHEYLALVDVETYPAFVDRNADHLDMMVHLAAQARALTALTWNVPDKRLRLRFLLTEEDGEHVGWSHKSTVASGWIRTHGDLCLTGRDRLLDCAQHRTHGLLRDEPPTRRDARPALLSVPPGLHSVRICRHISFSDRRDVQSAFGAEAGADFTVILHHYPVPPPRVAPVRLPGLMRRGLDESKPWGGLVAANNLHADPARKWRRS